jgi:valyl-tRNA synthetase
VGWPEAAGGTGVGAETGIGAGAEYNRYFPATLLETGYDILFFWVARMAMLSLELTGKAPFETVYMHGLVKDGQGNKMSKSKGNVIDPVDSIDAHGCDALRMALLSGTTPGMDISVSENKIETNRNFVNKLWNMGKYIMHTRGDIDSSSRGEGGGRGGGGFATRERVCGLPLLERYIVSRAHEVAMAVTDMLAEYKLAEASREVSDFVWNELADWFIEASKSRLKPDLLSSEDSSNSSSNSSSSSSSSTSSGCAATETETPLEPPPDGAVSLEVLLYVWEVALKLLHPFMPFVTEALWQQLPAADSSGSGSGSGSGSLMVSRWPVGLSSGGTDTGTDGDGEGLYVDSSAIADYEVSKSMVRAIRNTRAEYSVSPGKRIAAIVDIRDSRLRESVVGDIHGLAFLARLDQRSTVFVTTSAAASPDALDDPTLGETAGTQADYSDYVQLVIAEGVVVYLPLSDLINKEKEIIRITKQMEKLSADVEMLRNRLGGKFAEKAKPEVVKQTRSTLEEKENMLSALKVSLDSMTRMD